MVVLLLLTIPVGYAIGFGLQTKRYRRVGPIVLLTLGVTLFAVAGVVSGNNAGVHDQMADVARTLLQGSSLFVTTAGAAAGWAFTQRQLIASIVGVSLALVVGFAWGVVLLSYACWWLGDCMIWF